MKLALLIFITFVSLIARAKVECPSEAVDDSGSDSDLTTAEDRKPRAQLKTSEGHILALCYVGKEKIFPGYYLYAFLNGKKTSIVRSESSGFFRSEIRKNIFFITETTKDGNTDLAEWNVTCSKSECKASERKCPESILKLKAANKLEQIKKSATEQVLAKWDGAGCFE